MTVRSIILLGAGGHAKVIAATAAELGYAVVACFDDDEAKWGTELLGIPVRGPLAEAPEARLPAVIAVGDNACRQRIASTLPLVWATLIHPRAYLHESVTPGAGSTILAGAVIQPDALVGAHVIVNTQASIDHDCELGDYAHCGPGARLAGGVRVGKGALVGIGASIVPGIRIGAWAVLGAGSVAVEDVAEGSLALGVPARAQPRGSRC